MSAQCSPEQLKFEGLGGRRVVGAFDAPETSSDGGWLLLPEVEERRGILDRFAACFRDLRDPARRKHEVTSLIRQRVLALCHGYEDLNDHDALRDNALLALGCGHETPGDGLASRSTLNRLELTPAGGCGRCAVRDEVKRLVLRLSTPRRGEPTGSRRASSSTATTNRPCPLDPELGAPGGLGRGQANRWSDDRGEERAREAAA